MSDQSFDYTVGDFNYVEHPDGPQRLRLFMPVGTGPFPLVVDLHGGAWCNQDLKDCEFRDLALVRAGFAVAALNFRHAGSGYPTSLVDINYAIRWLKAHAGKLNVRADAVGLSGQSSGGHLAMLAAMRPADPRYAALPSPNGAAVDATVKAVVMQWPVINPLSRYRNAVRLRDSANPPAWVGDIPSRHELYWKTEAAMEEGNPIMLLERGEKVQLPPATTRTPLVPSRATNPSGSRMIIVRPAGLWIWYISTTQPRSVRHRTTQRLRFSSGIWAERPPPDRGLSLPVRPVWPMTALAY